MEERKEGVLTDEEGKKWRGIYRRGKKRHGWLSEGCRMKEEKNGE